MKQAKQHTVNATFVKYVFQNILGMLGMSLYILADTFFISQAEGANGLTALNLVLPIYSVIFAIGAMIGVGSATKFKIQRASGQSDADSYFSNAVLWAILLSIPFILIGVILPKQLISFLGGDATIVAIGTPYARLVLWFSPFFMLNHIFNAFVRNDGAPSLAMAATLSSSFFNIIMDYVFMFPLGLGMTGAALATILSPAVGVLICSLHFFDKKNTIRFVLRMPSLARLLFSCQLGVAAFVGEMSSGVTTIVFNFLILQIAGNNGVAAYGIVANVAIVATAIFNGISQGSQPLFSEYYGKKDSPSLNKALKLSICTAFVCSVLILLVINRYTKEIIAIFNSEQNQQMAEYALLGMKLYFIGYLFAGFNIVGAGILSATESAFWAFVTSLLRGFVAIIACAFTFTILFGMTGVWLAFPVAEFITAVVMLVAIMKQLASAHAFSNPSAH